MKTHEIKDYIIQTFHLIWGFDINDCKKHLTNNPDLGRQTKDVQISE